MAGNAPRGNPVAVSDLASQILDPVLRRRAGMSVALVQSWEEIVGPRLAQTSRPEKIQWPRRGDDGPFEPAVLVIACEGLAALHVQHETSEIIARANAFLGFGAIGRVRIVQKPVYVDQAPRKVPPRKLTGSEQDKLARMVDGVEDAGLRESLERLGATILGTKSSPRN
ncbi:MAG: DUF721 domain-containing protein [Rhizobiaceae bacterium]